jgi:hypothetical protein
MFMERVAVQRRIEVPHMAASKRFGRYKDEKEKTVRKASVKEDESLDKLTRIWKRFKRYIYEGPARRRLLRALKEVEYTPDDVTKFSVILSDFQTDEIPKWFRQTEFGKKVGLMLSALVENGEENDFTISIQNLHIPPDYLGYQNRKNVSIIGDVNSYLGFQMTAGRMIIQGNASTMVGASMEGGEIIVKGNVRQIGGDTEYNRRSRGGRIVVEGDVGEICTARKGSVIVVGGHVQSIGWETLAGEIHLDGTYDSIKLSSGSRTRIYHKGKLIVDK